MATIFLSLGSNLGDREKNITNALEEIKTIIQVDKISSLYETEPVEVTNQPLFLNCVVAGTSDDSANHILEQCLAIESKLGRVRTVRFGPRTIDIDILFYDDMVVSTNELTLPHPRLQERAFVLVPLNEIAPNFIHPVYKKSIPELLASVSTQGIHKWE